MLQTWGGSSKFDGGRLKSKHGGEWGQFKMLVKNSCEEVHLITGKNTCEGDHLIVKLPAISLQASKFTKMNFFKQIIQQF